MDPDDIDIDAFIEEAVAAAGDESRALAENVARNLTESVRQTRNALEAAVDARQTMPEIADATDLELAPKNEHDLEASFTTHLKAIQRRTADALARELKAQKFMGLNFELNPADDGTTAAPARIIDLDEYVRDNHANLGPHPHSNVLSVPIPPGIRGHCGRGGQTGQPEADGSGQQNSRDACGSGAPS